ncbi:Probable DNA mismatch repair protein Msh6 [Strongyloides ratti]|uniref:DNA mismatch repair protein n=1 Tax=Strongyloides ratti TaxID=34506 RepID=A0A090LFJ2_STRRB|nr:Probable DNA mismatch repair protein Msh6 [Strongyloides ratti]CEF66240.1 Probable DNA mismatch repair protein Msh6 [Strongyloides ratti]
MKQSSLTSFFTKLPQTPTGNSSSITSPDRKENIQNNFQKGEKFRVESNNELNFDESFSNSRSVKRNRQSVIDDPEDSPPTSVKSAQKRRRVYIDSDSDFEAENYVDKSESSNDKKYVDLYTPKLSKAFKKATISSAKKGLGSKLEKAFDEISNSKALNPSDIDLKRVVENMEFTPNLEKILKAGPSGQEEDFVHLTFDFLKPEKIKDINGRRPDDPEYDGKTLYVPESFIQKQTPAHRQWWRLKAHHYDTVLFFKIGKFYELFHMDSIIGHEHLGLSYMRGNFAHSGFPELSYGRYADQLISLGYKVARIEQTETPQMLEERCKKQKVKDKVVSRELCQIGSIATRIYVPIDEFRRKGNFEEREEDKYLMSIYFTLKEKDIYSFGVTFINTIVGNFYFSQFVDDNVNSGLRTLLSHFQPTQLLIEKKCSRKIVNLLSSILPYTQFEYLSPKSEFYEPDKTLYEMTDEKYFGPNTEVWPEVFKGFLSELSSAIPKVNDEFYECIKSFGGLLFYLQRFLIDVDMISMKNFTFVRPQDSDSLMDGIKTTSNHWDKRSLILDGDAIFQLNLLPPLRPIGVKTAVQSKENKINLYNIINNCSTTFGKRLLKHWIRVPTCDPTELNKRQSAISLLCKPEFSDICRTIAKKLKGLPDLEKLLQKNHANASKYRKENHPDGRAIMFEGKMYDRRKISDFVAMIKGFGTILDVVDTLKSSGILDCGNSALKDMFGDDFDFTLDEVKSFTKSFDQQEALKEGMIIPNPGVDSDYDEAVEDFNNCLKNLTEYLEKLMVDMRCPKLKYIMSGKNRYHIEVPDSDVKKLPSGFVFQSKTKGKQRFTSDISLELVKKLTLAEEKKENIRRDLSRKIYYYFDEKREKWNRGVSKISYFDCLLSLSIYSLTSGLEMTLPEFDYNSPTPYIDISQGNHPLLATNMDCALKFKGSKPSIYVSNDTILGKEKGVAMLMTGPNMGGKSTLMRQVATLVILAQLGSMVPAKSMKLTPVDRIFTRIGASDRIFGNESTYAVELNETNRILRGATKHSLVIIDELGRGTGTMDGLSIAGATLEYCASIIGCRTIFATHFQSLCTAFKNHKDVFLAHMACHNDNETNDPTDANITFLYTLTEGSCTQSYGFYVAKLAGLPEKLVKKAYAASLRLSHTDADIIFSFINILTYDCP